MIGIDTNILLRLWLNDDPAQNKRIDALLASHGSEPGSLLVTDVVLVEAIWTLKSAFAQDKAAQLMAVRSLLEDCLVVAKHAHRGCAFTATFDRGMRKLPDVKLL